MDIGQLARQYEIGWVDTGQLIPTYLLIVQTVAYLVYKRYCAVSKYCTNTANIIGGQVYITSIWTSHQLQVCYHIADLCTGTEVCALIADLKSISVVASPDMAVHLLSSFP